jgi:hypothetical protein
MEPCSLGGNIYASNSPTGSRFLSSCTIMHGIIVLYGVIDCTRSKSFYLYTKYTGVYSEYLIGVVSTQLNYKQKRLRIKPYSPDNVSGSIVSRTSSYA